MTPIITLNKFMIFNSNEGRAEGKESGKLLYHWTKDAIDRIVSLEEKIDDICLCDASISYSTRLSCEIVKNQTTITKPAERSFTLEFTETLVVVCEVEPNSSIWFAAHVTAPLAPDNMTMQTSNEDGIIYAEPNNIPAIAIEQVIRNLYNLFCILNGKFSMIADRVEQESNKPGHRKILRKLIRDKSRNLCNQYFNEILPEIHLHSLISNIPALYHYIVYQNLSLKPLMKVSSFMNHVTSLDTKHIEHSIVIFNDQLVWSSLSLFDTRLVYNYLISDVIKKALREELTAEVDKVRRLVEDQVMYLTNCGDDSLMNDNSSTLKRNNNPDLTHLSIVDKQLVPLYMTLFRSSNNMTIGLFLNKPNLTELLTNCDQVLTRDSRLGVIPLWSLAQSVGQNFLRKASSQQQQIPGSSHAYANDDGLAGSPTASNSTKRRESAASLKNLSFPQDLKYLVMNRMDSSFSWPKKIDCSTKEQSMVITSVKAGRFGSKSQRFIRWLLEFDPEMLLISRQTNYEVEEILAKLHNDFWLMVTNSEYRAIYSLNKFKNSVLSDANQSAMNLKNIVMFQDLQ